MADDVVLLRAAALQIAYSTDVDHARRRASMAIAEAAERGADIALLPEYWFAVRADADDAQRDETTSWPEPFLAQTSREADVLVAGNVLRTHGDTTRNTLVVYDAGRLVGAQDKVHLFPNEQHWNLQPGAGFEVFMARGARLGALVCADVLHPEAARVLAVRGAEIVLNPVMSPRRDPDPTRDAREALYVARAFDNACFVVKAGGFAADPQHPTAGRSLIAAPWGLLSHYARDDEAEVLIADLDIARLRRFRKEHLALDRRMPTAYRHLTDA